MRIIEMGGIGPGPFGAMLLADHGAEVIRVDRPGGPTGVPAAMLRSRICVELDLKKGEDRGALERLVATADGLIEGFRPGVMERLGLGPDALLARNPRLIYARITGWGQAGPYALRAGHDLNYIALSGAGHMSGPEDMPHPPPALLGDMGGGGMFLAFAMATALLDAQTTGEGQVIDCAMANGSALLATMLYGFRAEGAWEDRRAVNLLDGGAHFYAIYRTSDGKFVSIAAVEPQFYALLLERLGLQADTDFLDQLNRAKWPRLKEQLAEIFAERTQAEWCTRFGDSDACFAPVLSMDEAPRHPQNVAAGMFTIADGGIQPAPGPRYSKTVLAPPRSARKASVADLLDR